MGEIGPVLGTQYSPCPPPANCENCFMTAVCAKTCAERIMTPMLGSTDKSKRFIYNLLVVSDWLLRAAVRSDITAVHCRFRFSRSWIHRHYLLQSSFL